MTSSIFIMMKTLLTLVEFHKGNIQKSFQRICFNSSSIKHSDCFSFQQKSHDLLGNRSSGDSGSGSTGSGSGNSGGSGSHQTVTSTVSERFHGMGLGGRDRTLSGHHLGHSALANSSSVSLMGTGGGASSNHKGETNLTQKSIFNGYTFSPIS